jgi:hypothetical protein
MAVKRIIENPNDLEKAGRLRKYYQNSGAFAAVKATGKH